MIRQCDKTDLRLRLPSWVVRQLQDAAREAGVRAKLGPAAAAQILEEWAREREARIEQKRLKTDAHTQNP